MSEEKRCPICGKPLSEWPHSDPDFLGHFGP
jgi:hypothetical protein